MTIQVLRREALYLRFVKGCSSLPCPIRRLRNPHNSIPPFGTPIRNIPHDWSKLNQPVADHNTAVPGCGKLGSFHHVRSPGTNGSLPPTMVSRLEASLPPRPPRPHPASSPGTAEPEGPCKTPASPASNAHPRHGCPAIASGIRWLIHGHLRNGSIRPRGTRRRTWRNRRSLEAL